MSQVIINDHIYLAPIQESDLERLTSIANDIDISKNLKALPHPYTLADAQWWLAHTQKMVDSETEANRGIYIDGVYAGNCGRTRRIATGKHEHNYELGYWIGREYRGKGHMTDICRGLSDYIYTTRLDCHRQFACVYSRNTGSTRVLTKCGFTLEGTMREAIYMDGKWYDELVYGKVRVGF